MKQFFTFLFLSPLSMETLMNQNVGINTTSPDPSSELDIRSTTKGFLAPRMPQVQRIAIASPATSLLVYQTDSEAGFYAYSDTAWNPVGTDSGIRWNGRVMKE